MKILNTPLSELHKFFGISNAWEGPAPGEGIAYKNWRMEDHDAPILKYLYKNLKPKRHLEFGTWYGFGASLVAENSPATIWTLNLWEGEKKPTGENLYGHVEVELPAAAQQVDAEDKIKGLFSFLRKPLTPVQKPTPQRIFKASDSGELIGRLYRERGLGHRVNQIYCDSMDWDTSAYPDGFFDTIMIDGGHGENIVQNDTRKSLRLLRSGGLMIWHDYCPDAEIVRDFPTSKGVVEAINTMHGHLEVYFDTLHWIVPSYILIGVKK
jgi:predicted O-methyltransferase YrrM